MTAATQERASYREVLGHREFRAMFLSDALSILGDQVARLAVALLVFQRSGSATAASATYACSYLTWLIGGPILSTLADRLPRRRVMLLCDVVRLILVLTMCLPRVPTWWLFVALLLIGVATPPFEAARSALLADIVSGEMYVGANAITNMFAQGGQAVGFALGGALVAAVGARGSLLIDAATFAVSFLVLLARVQARPAPVEQPDAWSVVAETRAGVSLVFRTDVLRRLLGYAVAGALPLVAMEGLAVVVADEIGRGSVAAGLLTAAGAGGFVLGAALLLRVPGPSRDRLMPRCIVVSCLPLLVTPAITNLPALLLLWVIAGAGGAMQVIANSSFVSAVPPADRGKAFGVASTTLMLSQGAPLLALGLLADARGARTAVATAGIVSLLALGWLLRRPAGRHVSQAQRKIVRHPLR